MVGRQSGALGLAAVMALVATALAVLRVVRRLDHALLPGEAWTAAGAELVGLTVLVLIGAAGGALLGARRPMAAAGGALGAGVVGLLAAAGHAPDGPGLAVLLVVAVAAGAWGHRLWLVFVGAGSLALALAVMGLPPAPVQPVVGEASPDAVSLVVLVTLDTFRADHLGAIGGAAVPVPTPHLDGLAAQGLLRTHGVSPVPLTLPAHAAMLSGAPPDRHGVTRNGHQLGADADLVAEQLAAAGWRTGAAVSAAVLGHETGIGQGLAWHDDLTSDTLLRATTMGAVLASSGVLGDPQVERAGDRTVARALQWLALDPDRPTFLWVHLYDAHAPYDPPAPFDALVAVDTPGLVGAPADVKAARKRMRAAMPLTLTPGPSDLRPSVAAYKGEIAWVDSVVGQLLAGLPPDAAVVVTADHGESFLEHDYLLNHGDLLHEPAVRVPIIVRAPGVTPGRRSELPVGLAAVAPTLLDLAGLPAEGSLLGGPLAVQELSLFAGTQRSRAILGPFRRRLVGWQTGSEKWVVDSRGGVEHYDLSADPLELDPAPPVDVDVAPWLARGTAELERLRTAADAAQVAPGQQEALRALGYLD